MGYKKTSDLSDFELNEQIVIQKQGIANRQICSPVRLNNLLDERIRRNEAKIALVNAELNQMTNQSAPLAK